MFARDVVEAVSKHAVAEYPRESCGVVVGGRYFRCANVAPDPENGYEMAAAEYALYAGDVEAIFHSHPNGPEYPSESDMRTAVETHVPHGIVGVYKRGDSDPVCAKPFYWGHGVKRPPLMNRKFRHGVTDCYAMIRDWYAEARGVELPEYPRDWNWWLDGRDMYRRMYADAGFRQHKSGDRPVEGDVFLACIRSKGIINHAGIYLGNDLILHHPTGGAGYDPNSLSARVSASRYVNSSIFAGWLRYDPIAPISDAEVSP